MLANVLAMAEELRKGYRIPTIDDFVEKLLAEKEAEYDNVTKWFTEKYMDCEDDELVKKNEILQTKLNTEINLLYVILGN